MFPTVRLFVLLCVFWVLLSGFFTPFLLSAGALSALAVVLVARRMHTVENGAPTGVLGAQVLLYWLWLLKEIGKSGWQVSRIILDPALPISPTLVRFVPGQRTEVGLVVHANSITLTPGTISVEARPGEFLVHGLTRDAAQGTVDSEMDRRVTACERAR